MNPENLPAPSAVEADAKNRAFRTFVQGLGVDVATAVIVTMTPLMANVEWSVAWWVVVGLAVARSVVQAGVAYVARKLVIPRTADR